MEIPNCAERAEKAQMNATDINLSLVTDTLNVRLQSTKNKTEPRNEVGDNSSVGTVKHARNITPTSSTSKEYRAGTGLDQSKPPPKKAKLMRLERKQSKLLSLGKSTEEVSSVLKQKSAFNAGKTLEELFSEENMGRNKLEVR